MSKETIHVTIFDETYSLVTDEPEAHLSQAALMVDEQMREIAQAGFTDARKIAVLVSLQLASKLLREMKNSQECKEKHSTVTEWLKEQDQTLSDLI
jgi:cell division protein ZapA (FtsZ GTPase activity inhibitor)